MNKLITDNHNRRLVDPSIFKLRGKQILHAFFDEPYPVMMPEDEKMMREKLITGCAQNFKQQQELDMVEAVFNMLDTDKPDRNNRIWQKELLMNRIWMIPPRHHKNWMWLKLLQMQSFEIQQRALMNTLSTKWNINSVIHMRWPTVDLSALKAHDFRYGNRWIT